MIRADLDSLALPDTPGVYFFKKKKRGEKDTTTLYIGKATSLRDRVRSYFAPDLRATRGEHIVNMVEEASTVHHRTTDSVLEALLLEARLIKEHKPHYNTFGKDDKTFNVVIVTREDFPRVLLVRGRDLTLIKAGQNVRGIAERDIKYLFGPFPQGGSLKEALKLVRKIFPYRDTCTPHHLQTITYKLPATSPKPCFNAQLGLCPGVCAGTISKAEYQRTIAHIKLFFEGKKSALVRTLEKEMKAHADALAFEKAGEVKRTLFALNHIQDIALIKSVGGVGTSEGEEQEGERGFRIEAYDVAHTAGSETVGVMVVVVRGEPHKEHYRKFILRTVTNNDPAALKEILERRLTHHEWPLPDLIVVDGGTAQRNVAERTLKAHFQSVTNHIPLIGVVKDARHRPSSYLGPARFVRLYERAILLANAEAHRFAIEWHRKRRGKAMRGK